MQFWNFLAGVSIMIGLWRVASAIRSFTAHFFWLGKAGLLK
jgi:hypothetical protein